MEKIFVYFFHTGFLIDPSSKPKIGRRKDKMKKKFIAAAAIALALGLASCETTTSSVKVTIVL